MLWEMICSEELHTDHTHVSSHALLGADDVPPHKLNHICGTLVSIQACLTLGQPVLLGSR